MKNHHFLKKLFLEFCEAIPEMRTTLEHNVDEDVYYGQNRLRGKTFAEMWEMRCAHIRYSSDPQTGLAGEINDARLAHALINTLVKLNKSNPKAISKEMKKFAGYVTKKTNDEQGEFCLLISFYILQFTFLQFLNILLLPSCIYQGSH